MIRRLVSTLVVFPLFAAVGLCSASTPATAASSHWISGSYQLFIGGGVNVQTLVFMRDRSVGPPPIDGTWGVQNPKHDITITVAGGQASAIDCLRAGQGPVCFFSDQYSGPRTPAGIASQAAPGVANAYLGGDLIVSESFWAVRTGNVRAS